MATSGNLEPTLLQIVNYLDFGFPDAQAHHPMAWLPSCQDSSSFANPHPPQPPPPGVSAESYHHHHAPPDSYPPGLVRVCPPFLAPVHVVTNETVSLFSDFAHYLDTGRDEDGHRVVLDLNCMICLERKLQLPACVTANYPPGLEGPSFEWLAILPCGHFFGSDCLEHWLAESGFQSPDTTAVCPLCRFKLMYSCGHFLSPREYNPVRTRAQQVPMTLPEGGAIPRSCPECHYERIKEAIEQLRHLLFPMYIVPGDLVHPDSKEIMRLASLEFFRNMWRMTDMEEYYNRW
ncbi:hypothetical protein F5B17DRAFT_449003 [Nemania serpens]|nr:hypothetical protein F5B17DRAFT_449003 [Nemania serpens]